MISLPGPWGWTRPWSVFRWGPRCLFFLSDATMPSWWFLWQEIEYILYRRIHMNSAFRMVMKSPATCGDLTIIYFWCKPKQHTSEFHSGTHGDVISKNREVQGWNVTCTRGDRYQQEWWHMSMYLIKWIYSHNDLNVTSREWWLVRGNYPQIVLW